MALHSARMRQALRAGSPLVLLAEIDHPDGLVNVWSGIGSLTYDSKTWIGLGRLGQVTGAESSTEVAIGQFGLELRGIPAEAAGWLGDNVRNRVAQVWLGCLERPRAIVADPELILDGLLDLQILRAQEDGLVTLRLEGQRGIWNLGRGQAVAWSPEEQIKTYAGDTGLDLIYSLVNKDIRWTAS